MKTTPLLELAKTNHEKQILTQQSDYYENRIDTYKYQIRALEVYAFRSRILANYGVAVFDRLPNYETMIDDGKELVLESYLTM